jgi:hypothetical protein
LSIHDWPSTVVPAAAARLLLALLERWLVLALLLLLLLLLPLRDNEDVGRLLETADPSTRLPTGIARRAELGATRGLLAVGTGPESLIIISSSSSSAFAVVRLPGAVNLEVTMGRLDEGR